MVSLLENHKCFTPGFIDKIKSLYKEADLSHQLVLEQYSLHGNEPVLLACKKGCSYCCGLTVKVVIPELYIIFEHLQETRTNNEIERIIADLRIYTEKMAQSQTINEKLQIPCAFVENNTCSIYDVRPLPCRAWNSTSVKSCIDYLTDQDHDIPSSICHYAPYDTVKKGIMKGMLIAGFDEATEELNSGLLRLFEWENEAV